jgi:hypothetical protein
METVDSWLYNAAPVYQENNYLATVGTEDVTETEIATLVQWIGQLIAAELLRPHLAILRRCWRMRLAQGPDFLVPEDTLPVNERHCHVTRMCYAL